MRLYNHTKYHNLGKMWRVKFHTTLLLSDKLNNGLIRLKKSRTEGREPRIWLKKPRIEGREPSRKDSKRPLRVYIPTIVNRNIVDKFSVKLIYEHSSNDGTCVSPLVRGLYKKCSLSTMHVQSAHYSK